MNMNHLDARALNSQGGPIDALTATIRDATEAAFRTRDRQDERTLRRQIIAMRERQRGEDIRRELAAQGVSSVDELQRVMAAERDRKIKRQGIEDALDQDKVAAIGRADFDRDMAQGLATGMGTEYEQPELVPGGIGPVAPTEARGGVLRNLLKYDGTGMAPAIEEAAARGRTDREQGVQMKEAQIAATEALARHRDEPGTIKGAMTADQASDAARKAAMDAMGISSMADLAFETVDEPVVDMKGQPVNGLDGLPMTKQVRRAVPLEERQRRAAPFRNLYLQELNRRGFNEDGSPYVAAPTMDPKDVNPSDMVGFDINELLRMRQESGDTTPPIDLTQARSTIGTTAPGAKAQIRPPGSTVTAKDIAEYAAAHQLTIPRARANLAALGYKVQ